MCLSLGDLSCCQEWRQRTEQFDRSQGTFQHFRSVHTQLTNQSVTVANQSGISQLGYHAFMQPCLCSTGIWTVVVFTPCRSNFPYTNLDGHGVHIAPVESQSSGDVFTSCKRWPASKHSRAGGWGGGGLFPPHPQSTPENLLAGYLKGVLLFLLCLRFLFHRQG